jgi:hypothetical protein
MFVGTLLYLFTSSLFFGIFWHLQAYCLFDNLYTRRNVLRDAFYCFVVAILWPFALAYVLALFLYEDYHDTE